MRRLPPTIFALLCACADPLSEPSACGEPEAFEDAGEDIELSAWPEVGSCELDPAEPTHLVLTTTDFATGAVAVIDAQTAEVTPDVALASTDAIPFGRGGKVALVHRYSHDYVELLQPGSWSSRGQHALRTDTRSPNPQAIAFDDAGLAYVTLFGSPELLVLDLTQPPGSATIDAIDLSAVAIEDGVPEAGPEIRCGDILFVAVQQLDAACGYAPVGPDQLVAVDLSTRTPVDFDASREGTQGLPLWGMWLKQLRLDPSDPGRTTVLALTSGIERIDLATGQRSWAVSEEVFAAAGVSHRMLPIAFAVGPQGHWAYLAAYGPEPGDDVDCSTDLSSCFEEARLFEIDLRADASQLRPFFDGFQASERAIERVGDTLWVGSNAPGASGLYTFDITQHPPVQTAGLRPTGLPPYSLTSVAP